MRITPIVLAAMAGAATAALPPSGTYTGRVSVGCRVALQIDGSAFASQVHGCDEAGPHEALYVGQLVDAGEGRLELLYSAGLEGLDRLKGRFAVSADGGLTLTTTLAPEDDFPADLDDGTRGDYSPAEDVALTGTWAGVVELGGGASCLSRTWVEGPFFWAQNYECTTPGGEGAGLYVGEFTTMPADEFSERVSLRYSFTLPANTVILGRLRGSAAEMVLATGAPIMDVYPSPIFDIDDPNTFGLSRVVPAFATPLDGTWVGFYQDAPSCTVVMQARGGQALSQVLDCDEAPEREGFYAMVYEIEGDRIALTYSTGTPEPGFQAAGTIKINADEVVLVMDPEFGSIVTVLERE